MNDNIANEKVKITIKIWRPIFRKFDERIKNSCLRRDAYLAEVLETEIEYLDKEVSIPNSTKCYEYIKNEIARLDTKSLSLALPRKLVERLTSICERKLIVRDAFFNRLFFLLVGSSKSIDKIFFAHLDVGKDWRQKLWFDILRDDYQEFRMENLQNPLSFLTNPFWHMRDGLEIYDPENDYEEYLEPKANKKIKVFREINGDAHPINRLYTKRISIRIGNSSEIKTDGINCFLPDTKIPSTKSYIRKEDIDKLI